MNDSAILQEEVYAVIRQLYRHPKKLFPTQQPQSIDTKILEKIFGSPETFVVSQKANGIHMTLVVGTVASGDRFCCLMDRTGSLFFYEISCLPEYFLGTLVTGEVLSSRSQTAPGTDRVFLAFDVVSVSGKSYLTAGYRDRMEAAQRLEEQATALFFVAKGIHFRKKPFYELSDFLYQFEPVSEDDGLIFMPLNKPLTQTLPYKWKEHHTVDFLVDARFLEGQWSWEISQPIGIGRVVIDTSSPLVKTLEDFLQPSVPRFSVIFECILHPSPIELIIVPKRIRHDKSTANSAATVMGTVESIKDNITHSELVNRFLQINK
jgi:hypothetical protein